MNDSLQNQTPGRIFGSALMAAAALFVNGLGVYLTIRANIGAGPWDVLNLGLSNTVHVLYGTASISVSLLILLIDILLHERIGIAMFIDAFVVGKAVDFFTWTGWIPGPANFFQSLLMLFAGLVIEGYTQYFYMKAALGCGPRDTLLVGLKRRTTRLPIGLVSVCLLSAATLIGYLLGGPVGIGTLINALCAGPIMQFAFQSVRFDATAIRHQSIPETVRILFRKKDC